MRNNKKDKKRKNIQNAIALNASSNITDKAGNAVKEHIVSYTGESNTYNNVTGKVDIKTLKRSLRSISKSKINPDYKNQNLRQQAGFSAEIKEVAKNNAEQALRGDCGTKTTRTDDMMRQADGNGNIIGGTNDQLYDLADVDVNGHYIEGTGRQMKFVGKDGEACANKLLGKSFDKYRDADVPIEIPSDYFEDTIQALTEQEDSLAAQIEKAVAKENPKLAERHKKSLERVKKTKSNLRKSNISSKGAMFARKHPKLSTAMDIGGTSLKAGASAAKSSVLISGAMSSVQNIVSVIEDEKSIENAAQDIVRDSSKAGLAAFTVTTSSSIVKGVLKNSSKEAFQKIASTSIPDASIVLIYSSAQTIREFYQGDITTQECLLELGEKSCNVAGSYAGGALGTVVGGPVGGTIGSIVGGTLTSGVYNIIVKEWQYIAEEKRRKQQEAFEAMMRYYAEEKRREEVKQMIHANTVHAVQNSIRSIFCSGELQRLVNAAESYFKNREEVEMMIAERVYVALCLKEYREQLKKTVDTYFAECRECFDIAFDTLNASLESKDYDEAIRACNVIADRFSFTSGIKDTEDFENKFFGNEKIVF